MEGAIFADEIVGEKVVIRSKVKIWTRRVFRDIDRIGLIEATSINLRNVKAARVNGQDIVIGPKCHIDAIDCSGTLHIDSSATVGTVTGEYAKV
jgi:hypothetical protein